MATITKKKLVSDYLPAAGSAAPYGDSTKVLASLATNASGVYTDGDSASAIGATDKVRIGILPGGMRLDDAVAIVSDAFRASTTGSFGFEYVDGVDDANVPQNAAYFFSGLAMDSVALTRKSTTTRPVTLPKDAYLIYTNAVAAQNVVGVVDVIVQGTVVGMP